MINTDQIADCVFIYLAARTVVHARHRLRATRRARLRRDAGAADLRRARHALAAARAELEARRTGVGWRIAHSALVGGADAITTEHAARSGGYRINGSLHARLLARTIEPAACPTPR